MATQRICSIDGCGKAHEAKGFCQSHYQRFHKYGDPLAGNEPISEKGGGLAFVDALIRAAPTNECVIWPYGTGQNGYGTVVIQGKTHLVHRVVCEAVNGESTLQAAHSCGVPSCCNPLHLRWATRSQNMMDRIAHGTDNRGQKHGMAKLKDSDIPVIRNMAGKLKQKEIAKMFGVSRQTIGRVQSLIDWSWIP